jgi:hypothetical protein
VIPPGLAHAIHVRVMRGACSARTPTRFSCTSSVAVVKIPIVDEAAFWSVIDQFDWDKAGDDSAVLRPALNALSSMPPEDIAAFEQILAAKLYALDTREHARWCYLGQSDPDNGDDYISSDDFLYSRCVIVANGRKFFEEVVSDPSKFPRAMEFESLLFLARRAYELRTGQPMDVVHNLSWESFSNADGWRPTSRTSPGRYTGANIPPLNRRPT